MPPAGTCGQDADFRPPLPWRVNPSTGPLSCSLNHNLPWRHSRGKHVAWCMVLAYAHLERTARMPWTPQHLPLWCSHHPTLRLQATPPLRSSPGHTLYSLMESLVLENSKNLTYSFSPGFFGPPFLITSKWHTSYFSANVLLLCKRQREQTLMYFGHLWHLPLTL